MRVSWLAVLLSALAVVASAQVPESSSAEPVGKPSFEVASVRPNVSAPNSMSFGGGAPGRFEARNVTLELLITQAYGIRRDQLDGAPDWVAEERFDITARAPDGAPAAQVNLMLQSLLEDRFRLVTHRETRESDVFALVVVRGDGQVGPQLSPTTDDCARVRAERAAAAREAAGRGGRGVVARNMLVDEWVACETRMAQRVTPGGVFATVYRLGGVTLGAVARLLEGSVGAPVADRTGLTGEYDVELVFTRAPALATTAPDGTAAALDETPTIFTAVEEQLGLKLQAERGPVEFLVIDGVERPEPN